MTEQLEDYILRHIDPEPSHLYKLDRDTHIKLLYPRMCSGHVQGRLLKMLTEMIRPSRILELGTFTGYSALCFAEGAAGEVLLHHILVEARHDDDDEHAA